MQRLKSVIYRGMLYVFTLVLVAGQPIIARADTTPTTGTSSSGTTASAPKNYTYDPGTGHWDTDAWHYDSATGTYQPVLPPTPAPAPTPASAPAPTSSSDPSTATPASQASTSQGSTPNGGSTIASTLDNNAKTNVNSSSTINNALNSAATSGNAGVVHNTLAGDATSGNASADATIVNAVHSSVQGDNGGVAHFVADINGNVNGDITLYPAIANVTSNTTNNNAVNVNNNTAINNNLTLGATSGGATVTGNSSAGNATSGAADTVANVVNLVNSIIAANKSFIGTVNIHGNLNGDILISPDFIPQLLASNSGGTVSSTTKNNLAANLNNNQAIINNIQLAANSGNATVANNTSAGGATTGTGQTNLTVLNLTGNTVVAKDSILVFVNVLGKWIGVIAGAPTGTTAAMLGNGVSSSSNVTNNLTANVNNNGLITNNLKLASQSGDATVANNTLAGNATSGNATASANILNIDTSSFKLSDWFGIVFINVFGTWNGSFGIDTASGNMVPIEQPDTTPGAIPLMQFGFAPRQPGAPKTHAGIPLASMTYQSSNQQNPIADAQVTLASAKVDKPATSGHSTASPSYAPQTHSNWSLPLMLTMGAMMGLPLLGLVALARRWLGF